MRTQAATLLGGSLDPRDDVDREAAVKADRFVDDLDPERGIAVTSDIRAANGPHARALGGITEGDEGRQGIAEH